VTGVKKEEVKKEVSTEKGQAFFEETRGKIDFF
jgi:hypothetical protein